MKTTVDSNPYNKKGQNVFFVSPIEWVIFPNNNLK